MKVAIIGGGISGLAAAYELELARKRGTDIDWRLYESTSRLGGIIETTRHNGFILEGGPDGWVTEKPWARDLAIELGLESDLIYSNDVTRKTYIWKDSGNAGEMAGALQPIPDRMRLMVPEDLSTLDDSPLFSPSAKQAYADELANAAQLREAAPDTDESIASFVRRHFGDEVLRTLAAPLLSGVFGGDVERLSVRAVLPAFVAMEREHGSLIAALQSKTQANKPIFTTLRNGAASLTESLTAQLPPERLHLNRPALSLKREGALWCLRASKGVGKTKKHFHHILLATPADTTRTLLHPLAPQTSTLIPQQSSSAILVTFAWPAETASTLTIPQGFGFLVPQLSSGPWTLDSGPSLLACTFVDQKFPHRAPPGTRILRAFFGGASAEALANASDEAIANAALTQLRNILGPIPGPTHTEVRRWPHSLPQYEVGHLDRIAELETRIAALGNLTLLGNSYRGVGIPDLIHAARTAARTLTT
ncbi:MAG TPA: protoporphyrinogen oxidase [Acidobacteriaceae bacterium]